MPTNARSLSMIFNAILCALAEQKMKALDVKAQIENLRQLMSHTSAIQSSSNNFQEESSGIWHTEHGFPIYWWSVDDCYVLDHISITFSLHSNRIDSEAVRFSLSYIEGDATLYFMGEVVATWNIHGKEFPAPKSQEPVDWELCGVCYHYDVNPETGICSGCQADQSHLPAAS